MCDMVCACPLKRGGMVKEILKHSRARSFDSANSLRADICRNFPFLGFELSAQCDRQKPSAKGNRDCLAAVAVNKWVFRNLRNFPNGIVWGTRSSPRILVLGRSIFMEGSELHDPRSYLESWGRFG